MDRRHNEKAWAILVRQWKESGKSQREFCRVKKISFWSFRGWRTKLLKMETMPSPLVELPIAVKIASHPQNDLRILLPGGIVIETSSSLGSEGLFELLTVIRAL